MTHPHASPLVETALRVHESRGAAAAFRALCEGLGEAGFVRGLWRTSPEGSEAWPEGAGPPPPEALSRAAGEEGTTRTGDGEGGEVVVLALGDGLGGVVAAVEPRRPADAAAWERLRAALRAVAERERDDRAREAERQVLLHRAEESEALHILGLAANRTLDPDEVLSLVARFTRTLLGAHYVTVSTREGGHIRTMAAVGLRANEPLLDDDPFAREVIDAGNPLGIGGDGVDPEAYAFHAAEGMQAGLGVPLSLFGDTFGALVVGYRREYRPAPQDTRLALTLAGHAAVAISNARLHRALAERSDELSEALEEVRRTSRAKERFFASMSHELRTPLNGIIGFQTLVLEEIGGEVPSGVRTFVERANRAARNLLRIVDEVLDYAKIEAGKVDLRLRTAAVHELVDEAVSTLEPMAAGRKLRLHSRTAPGVLPIRTDPGRVRQILVNLLSNAVKFTPEGGEIRVTAGAVEGGVEVRVRDSGPGIADEDQQRIFQEFEQVGGTVGGTGLGLPISRRLARVLGGDLTVESRPGDGSTFVLRLPPNAPGGVEVAVGSAL